MKEKFTLKIVARMMSLSLKKNENAADPRISCRNKWAPIIVPEMGAATTHFFGIPAVHAHGSKALRPWVTPGLLVSENTIHLFTFRLYIDHGENRVNFFRITLLPSVSRNNESDISIGTTWIYTPSTWTPSRQPYGAK